MALFSKLFGSKGRDDPAAQPEMHDGFRIFPEPKKDSGGYRIEARIEKEVCGETRVHHLIRADTVQSFDEAVSFSIRKARQVIDEQGDGIF